MESLTLSATIPSTPEQVFDAWVHPELHAQMTGGAANGETGPGGKFTAWDGYITGQFLELERPGRIVMAWRTLDFPKGAPDSRVEISLSAQGEGEALATALTLSHTQIPKGQADQYRGGWAQFYFDPMVAHFSKG